MPNRVPSFTYWGNLGLCVIYPVSIHVSGRQWEDKSILVTLKAWDEGIRCFGFADSFGVTQPEYVPSPKVEKSIQKAVDDCRLWDERMTHLCQLNAQVREMKALLGDMLNEYDFSVARLA